MEKKCREQGVSSPLDLKPPRLEFSDLQDTLEKRADLHSTRDIERRLDSSREEYYNGAIFGFDPTKSPEEVDENWSVRVIPNDDYLHSPRLAGSAWKHIERRKMDD